MNDKYLITVTMTHPQHTDHSGDRLPQTYEAIHQPTDVAATIDDAKGWFSAAFINSPLNGDEHEQYRDWYEDLIAVHCITLTPASPIGWETAETATPQA